MVMRITAFVITVATALNINLLSTQATEIGNKPHVLGYQKCMDCHELPAEAWMRSSHALRSLEMLDSNQRASRYAQRLGIDPTALMQNSVCIDCHGTRQHTVDGPPVVSNGVSCESCHGAAGESSTFNGWYELHSGEVSLPEGAVTDLKTVLRGAGMAGTDNLYKLAVRCHSCHTVSNEAVVQAGHVAGTHEFEFATWFSGEVRHNFAPYTVDIDDEERNASASNLWLTRHPGTRSEARQRLMYVVGQLADLEVSLRNRAKATQAGTFATSAASRSTAALMRLQQVANPLQDKELSVAIADLRSIRTLLFLPPRQNHTPLLTQAADRVAQTARQFLDRYDGAELIAIQALLANESKGQAFQP
jgi:hypothetical protein